jgi:hypothetical protein
MTGSTRGPRMPGTILLKIARLLFDDFLLSTVVQPTICDLQREVADAGPRRLDRLRARWRGYSAFWRIALVGPFAFPAVPAGDAGTATFPGAVARLAIGSIAVMLLAIAARALGVWALVVAAVLALFATLLHTWYDRHPSDIPNPEPQQRRPQINFSSTDVAGNIGGLIFVVGSVFIVALALPWVVWFLFTATIAACVLAWALVSWRTRHPRAGLPENRIVLR